MGRPKGSKNKPKPIEVVEEAPEPELHGQRPGRPVIETCPNCLYAYADGGYCEECGWTKEYKIGVQFP